MKKYIIPILTAVIFLTGCKDFLEVKSSYVLSEDEVNSRPELVETQFLSYYPMLREYLPTLGLCRNTFGYHHLDAWGDDLMSNIIWMFADHKKFTPGYAFSQKFQMGSYKYEDSSDYAPYWPYSLINKLNKTIQQFNRFKDDENYAKMLGEAYFIRAYLYLQLVQRYGGVPIYTEPFDDAVSVSDRLSEEDCWDFVSDQLDSAIFYLPETCTYASENKDRSIRTTALALKSRAMLYAGSLAKYGAEPFNNGFQGVPASRAKEYFQQAAKAASEVAESKVYSLSSNFAAIFDATDKNNNEIIFRFGTQPKTVGLYVWYDRYFAPVRYQENSGAFMVPSLDAVEAFETTDGQIKELDYSRQYPSQSSIFDGRDKRLYASVLLPGSTFVGLTMDIYNRSVVHTASGDKNYQWDDWTQWNSRSVIPGHENYYQTGLDGVFLQTEGKGVTNSGFYLKKMLYGVSHLDKYGAGLGDQDAVVIRYGETVLNLCEAAAELAQMGDNSYMADAQALFDELRSVHGGLPSKALDIENVRHERRVEMMFECHRYFDLKRWHRADLVHQVTPNILHPVLHIDERTSPETVWYTIEKVPANLGGTEVGWFEERDYYCPLPCDVNPGLVQNIGWEGVSSNWQTYFNSL